MTDISTVSLVVGNQIIDPASFQAVVTAPTSGPQSETITYSAWSVDPAIVNRLHSQGFGAIPTPDAVVASAHAFADLYGVIPNTNLCNWIGDNVAAGAGAPMPLPDALLDPTSNVAGGFWRVHYRGTEQLAYQQLVGPRAARRHRAHGLVHAGDRPRVGAHHDRARRLSGADGRITVYDNDGFITGPTGRQEVIDIHHGQLLAGHRSCRHHDLPPRSQPAVPDRGHPAGGTDPGLGLQRPDPTRRRRRHHHRRAGRQRDPGHDGPSQHRHRHRSQRGRHARLHRSRFGACRSCRSRTES